MPSSSRRQRLPHCADCAAAKTHNLAPRFGLIFFWQNRRMTRREEGFCRSRKGSGSVQRFRFSSGGSYGFWNDSAYIAAVEAGQPTAVTSIVALHRKRVTGGPEWQSSLSYDREVMCQSLRRSLRRKRQFRLGDSSVFPPEWSCRLQE